MHNRLAKEHLCHLNNRSIKEDICISPEDKRPYVNPKGFLQNLQNEDIQQAR